MKLHLIFVALFLLSCSAGAQEKTLSSKQLMTRSLYPNHPMRGMQFVGKGSSQIAYIKDTVLYVGTAKSTKPMLALAELNNVLTLSGEPALRALPHFEVLSDKEVRFDANGKRFVYNKDKRTLVSTVDYGKGRANLHIASNGNYAYTEGNALVVCSQDGVTRIDDPNEGVVFGQSVHRNEFGISGGIYWSPSGSSMAFYRMDQSMVTDYPMVNTATRIATAQPFRYPMAGMKSHEVTVGIWSPSGIVYLDTRKDTSLAEREMYLTNLTWSPDGKSLYIAKVNRGQNHAWLERYNVATGKLEQVLFEETNPRYVEPCEGLYFLPNDPNGFLWFSMRDGYKHLYLYRTDGTLVRQLTAGAYEVQEVIGFDAKGENLFVYANKDNLAGRAAYRVNIATGEMMAITPTEGTHTVVVSNDGKSWFDRYSSTTVPARCDLVKVKGKALSTTNLYSSPNPLAEYAMPGIQLGTLKAADGKTDLYYRLLTPPHMDSTKQYPTLVYVYGGPHSQLVTDSWLAGANLYFTFLAQQGYVVFTLDNRGTDHRGFEFESCTHRQLGTIEMADQMQGVKFLHSLPYVDKDRMGVEGWSFGGFMTITMKLAHPEIFKVGCAGGPVIDWKWYEVMYGERYMDTPQENPEGYANASLVSKAKDLQGRLLVIHGAEDNTVVWQNSIEFIEACINAGKQVDYFVYPHHEHNVIGPERVHLFEKMFDYYETHLK